MIGILQVLEVLKIILSMPDVISGRLLLFDALETKFHNMRLRSKDPNCTVCGEHAVIRELIDYEEFCGARADDKVVNLDLLKKDERITVREYARIKNIDSISHILIDVRSSEEYQICHLLDSVNVPFSQLSNHDNLKLIRNKIKEAQEGGHNTVNCKILLFEINLLIL